MKTALAGHGAYNSSPIKRIIGIMKELNKSLMYYGTVSLVMLASV
jgi:hypothetical protein